MKNKKKSNLKVGILTLLPIIVFIYILKWFINTILGISNNLLFLLPIDSIFDTKSSEIIWYWQLTSFIISFIMVWFIGLLMNHYYIGIKINKILKKIVKKIPILNTLFRMSDQINKISSKKTSFKEVVFVEFPAPGIYTIGFITSDEVKTIEKTFDEKVYNVFIPTTPNPTNGYLCIVKKEKIIKTNISIGSAIEYVISMGTLVDIKEIEKLEKKEWFYCSFSLFDIFSLIDLEIRSLSRSFLENLWKYSNNVSCFLSGTKTQDFSSINSGEAQSL